MYMENKLVQNIIKQLKDILDQDIWLDENFHKKWESISDRQAFERPLPEMHSVGELISHLIVWRLEIIKRLQGHRSSLTDKSPENWKTNDELRSIGWLNLKNEFINSQHVLIQLLADKNDQYLENELPDGSKFHYLIEGLIHHDLYHLGQLGITIKYLKLQGKT